MEDVKCPKCGSTQITAQNKGFSGGKAVAGAVLTGGIGLLAGLHGSKNVMITCLSCGNKHKAGDYQKEKTKFDNQKRALDAAQTGNQTEAKIAIWIIAALAGFISYKLYVNDWNFFGTIFALATLILAGIGSLVLFEKKN